MSLHAYEPCEVISGNPLRFLVSSGDIDSARLSLWAYSYNGYNIGFQNRSSRFESSWARIHHKTPNATHWGFYDVAVTLDEKDGGAR
jgi:hypothetical protein